MATESFLLGSLSELKFISLYSTLIPITKKIRLYTEINVKTNAKMVEFALPATELRKLTFQNALRN